MPRTAILILEDNNEKIQPVLLKYKDVMLHNAVYIARNVAQAQWFVQSDPGMLWVFLDEDLGPGNGTGTGFLAWLLETAPHFLVRVVATSYSLEACKQWRRMCDAIHIPIERSWE